MLSEGEIETLNSRKLKKAIMSKMEQLCKFLVEERETITEVMKDNIMMRHSTPILQTEALCDLLPQRTKRAYIDLYEACKEYGLKDAADILRPKCGPHIICIETGRVLAVSDAPQPLPDTWPIDEHVRRVKDNTLEVKKVTDPSICKLYDVHLEKEHIFPMRHKCRGNALIINIESFTDPDLSKREGSHMDEKGLVKLFEGLGFRVNSGNKDLNRLEIDALIEKEVQEDHNDHDCFVFFFLSHGLQGMVLDTNGQSIAIKRIIKEFMQVEDLKTKPKLFFFQACQADEGDTASAPVEDISLSAGASSNLFTDLLDELSDGTVFLFRSSPDGTCSIRMGDSGSWFVQAIIYVFSEYAHKCEIEELFCKANDLLSKAETETLERTKNVGEFLFSPGRKLYFFPGLPEQ